MWDITEGLGWSRRQLPRRPGSWQTPHAVMVHGLFPSGKAERNQCLLLVNVCISSLNVSSSKRSHPNTCLFVAQLSLLFISCLYCLSFIHNSSHMIQNRLIQALSNCQTTTHQSGSASSSARSSTMASSSLSDNPGGSRSLV